MRGDSSFVLYIFGQICLRSFRTVGLGISSVKWPSDQNCIRIQHTKSKNWLWPRNTEIKVELTLFRHFFKNFGWLLEIVLEALSPFFFFFEGPTCTWPIPALTLGTADVARKDPNCAKIDLFWPATWFLRVLDYRRFPWDMTNVPKSTGSQLFQTESQLIFPGSGPFSKSFKLHLSILAKRWRKWDWVLLKMAVE